ncbi:hypothetical protein [Nocardia rhizosphaerae]|uniref:Uncharacterized protein n=1 Tax=Nocardia rhizosphaerae TaxID=1691571 RepID=A0ABV8L367_9NOCA
MSGWLQHLDGTWSRVDETGRLHTMALGPWDDTGGQLQELDADVRAGLAVLDALQERADR